MNWTLIISIAIILVFTFIGRRKGFVKTIFVLFSSIVVFALTCIANPFVKDLLVSSDAIYNVVYDNVNIESEKDLSTGEDCKEYIEGMNLPSVLEDKLTQVSDSFFNSLDQASDSCEEFLSDKITVLILSAISFIITYILIFLAVSLIGKALNIIVKLPVLNFANKLLGGIAGFLGGVAIVMIFMSVMSFLTSTAVGGMVMSDIKSSTVLGFIYENNIFTSVVSYFAKF